MEGRAQGGFDNANILDLIDRTDFKNQIQKPEFEYEGSPFLDETFVKGDIYYNNAWRFVIGEQPDRSRP